ncbi:hypothetical protein YPPY91_2320, partial [Yersinia pestis PY-91]
MICQWLGS